VKKFLFPSPARALTEVEKGDTLASAGASDRRGVPSPFFFFFFFFLFLPRGWGDSLFFSVRERKRYGTFPSFFPSSSLSAAVREAREDCFFSFVRLFPGLQQTNGGKRCFSARPATPHAFLFPFLRVRAGRADPAAPYQPLRIATRLRPADAAAAFQQPGPDFATCFFFLFSRTTELRQGR